MRDKNVGHEPRRHVDGTIPRDRRRHSDKADRLYVKHITHTGIRTPCRVVFLDHDAPELSPAQQFFLLALYGLELRYSALRLGVFARPLGATRCDLSSIGCVLLQ